MKRLDTLTTLTTLTTLIILMSAGSAWAHPGHGGTTFTDGLVHPLLGLDHWLAMPRLLRVGPAVVALAGAGMLAFA